VEPNGASRPRSFREAITCALRGTRLAARSERHFRAHLVIAVLALLAAAWAGFAEVELGLLTFTIALVLVSELVNTAIEMLTDLLHPGAGRRAAAVKDVAAAAVLVSTGLALVVGAVLFLPHVTAAPGGIPRVLALLLALVLLAAFLAGAVRPGPAG
jgi:diacylglycerol kinase (ATP)